MEKISSLCVNYEVEAQFSICIQSGLMLKCDVSGPTQSKVTVLITYSAVQTFLLPITTPQRPQQLSYTRNIRLQAPIIYSADLKYFQST